MSDDISILETIQENNERAGQLMSELERLWPDYVFVRRGKVVALMAAAKALPELAFHCADRGVRREAYDALAALRAAGIDLEEKT